MYSLGPIKELITILIAGILNLYFLRYVWYQTKLDDLFHFIRNSFGFKVWHFDIFDLFICFHEHFFFFCNLFNTRIIFVNKNDPIKFEMNCFTLYNISFLHFVCFVWKLLSFSRLWWCWIHVTCPKGSLAWTCKRSHIILHKLYPHHCGTVI